MRLSEMKAKFNEEYAKIHQRETELKGNPTLAQSPEAKKRYRKIGLVLLLVVALPLTIGNYVGYQATGRFITLLLATNIVMLGLGLIMTMTGKNPLPKQK